MKARSAAHVRAQAATVALLILLTGVTLVFLTPIFWMVSTSLKSNRHVFDLPIQWVPRQPLWANYPAAYTTVHFTRYFANSAIVTGSVTVINVLLSALAGYGLAKYRFLGRHVLLVAILATLMLPLEVVMVPLYLTVQRLGWLNSYQGMIVPVAANALGVLMMRQYFLSLPDDLISAARIDGDDEQLKLGHGYDHNYVLNHPLGRLDVIARAHDRVSGRVLEALSTEPGMQFYTGNHLNGTITGKGGWTYQARHGFCFEAQHFPDSPNKSLFPSVVLKPGQVYENTIIYRFSAE